MDLYGISLVTGATGLVAMAVGGLSHSVGHVGHGHGGGHGAVGHGHGGAAHAAGGHAGHGAAAHGGHASHAARDTGQSSPGWQSLLSPRLLFAVLVGFGAGGLVAAPLGEPFRAVCALAAAAAFETLLVGPIWRFLFRFESSPALTLGSAIDDEARAVTSFDAQGCGLVAVEVDGQLVQLLATLDVESRDRGVRIRSGDVVRIAAVDEARGRCTVRENDR